MKKQLGIFSIVLLIFASFSIRAQTSTNPHKVVITWPASPSVGVTGYNVKRAAGSCVAATLTFTTLSTTVPVTLTYTDTSVTEGTTYCYLVTTVTTAGESANAASGTIEVVIPIGRASSVPLPPGAPVAGPVQ